jgi:hypothetical protein
MASTVAGVGAVGGGGVGIMRRDSWWGWNPAGRAGVSGKNGKSPMAATWVRGRRTKARESFRERGNGDRRPHRDTAPAASGLTGGARVLPSHPTRHLRPRRCGSRGRSPHREEPPEPSRRGIVAHAGAALLKPFALSRLPPLSPEVGGSVTMRPGPPATRRRR